MNSNQAAVFNILSARSIQRIEDLVGFILVKVDVTDDEVRLYLTEECYAELYHSQNCCESVNVESVVGDVNDLVGEELLLAEESSSDDNSGRYESATWTFYKFATRKGYVDIRFHGSSNGYYSESVSFALRNEPNGLFGN